MPPEALQAELGRPRAAAPAWWPLAGLAILVFAALTITRADADLWGHVRFGLDTLHTHRLTSIDPYSFTQDRAWINHEWLSELQMGLAYSAGGSPGLALLKAALAFTPFAFIWFSTRGAAPGVRLLVIVLLVLGTIHMTSSLRPQLWTFVAFAILCRALVNPRSRARAWLPVLFAAWANLHGGWIVGLGVLGVWAAAEIWSRPVTMRTWLVVAPACTLATLCTPYGWNLWRFMAETVGMSREVQEWQPLLTTPFLNWVPWFVGVGAIVWVASRRLPARLPAVAALAMLGYASFRVLRIESLFVESAMILLAPVMIEQWPSTPAGRPAQPSHSNWPMALVLTGIPIAGAAWICSWSLSCLPPLGSWAPDAAPVRWLSSNTGGRLVTSFNWGEYAIWHLGPRLRVSIDGRRETIYSERRIAENEEIVAGTPAGLDVVAQWRPEYVWLPATSVTTHAWLTQHGYRIELETRRSFVAVRGDLQPLAAPAGSVSLAACFPD